MAWKEVRVVASEGTEVGVVDFPDDPETLRVVIRRPGEEWPHKTTPMVGANLTIEPGRTEYVVQDEQRMEEEV